MAWATVDLHISLLGPIKVFSAGTELYIGPSRQREVLAVLALHHRRVMSVGQLTTAVWGAHAPSSAANLVHTYVGRLRRALRRVAGCPDPTLLLRSHRPGYLLSIDQASVDVARFEDDARRARAAFAQSDLASANALLGHALAQWRGTALHDATGPLAVAERVRLHEMRQELAEELLYTRLVLGDHCGIVADLRHMLVQDPMRERLWALLVAALDRTSRRAEAVTAYHEARALLRERLGIDPGPELQALYRDLLHAVPVAVSSPAGWQRAS